MLVVLTHSFDAVSADAAVKFVQMVVLGVVLELEKRIGKRWRQSQRGHSVT